MGGTGLWPVVSGVPPETIAGCDLALVSAHNQQWMVTDEIQRDARATILKTCSGGFFASLAGFRRADLNAKAQRTRRGNRGLKFKLRHDRDGGSVLI